VEGGLNGTVTAAAAAKEEEEVAFSGPADESAKAGRSDGALSDNDPGPRAVFAVAAAAARGVSEGSRACAEASPPLSLARARCCLAARLRPRCSDWKLQ